MNGDDFLIAPFFFKTILMSLLILTIQISYISYKNIFIILRYFVNENLK
jgi:hypothetical protein